MNRYFVTEEQIGRMLNAVKKLPVKADNFNAADMWVWLYLAIESLHDQVIKEPEKKLEPKGE